VIFGPLRMLERENVTVVVKALFRRKQIGRLAVVFCVFIGCGHPLLSASAGTDIVIMLDMSMGETPQDPILRTVSAGARAAATELEP
jgi:hypothetical protein